MKITVKSSCNPYDKEVQIQSTTLGDLFEELSGEYKPAGFEFYDSEHGGVLPDCEVVINGQQYEALVQSLETRVKDGDRIEIYILLVPGG